MVFSRIGSFVHKIIEHIVSFLLSTANIDDIFLNHCPTVSNWQRRQRRQIGQIITNGYGGQVG